MSIGMLPYLLHASSNANVPQIQCPWH